MDIVEQIDKINRQLTVNGYKLTPQREITLKVLLENERDHLSAEDVFMLVRQKFPEIGLATVYRTLELLAELNIVQKMNFGDGVARFDLRQEGHDHMHHHLVCRVCGALEEIQDDWLLELEQRVDKSALLLQLVVVVGQQERLAAAVELALDGAQYLGIERVHDVVHDDADDTGAGGAQRGGAAIVDVADGAGVLLDAVACRARHQRAVAQGQRNRGRRDAERIGNGRKLDFLSQSVAPDLNRSTV